MSHQTDTTSSDRSTRRDFLSRTGVGLSAVATANLALTPSVHAAGSDSIRIGMIGSGSRCSGAATQAMKAGTDVKLVAMCDIFEQRLQSSRVSLKQISPEQVQVDDDHCFVGLDGYQKVIDSVDVVLIACALKFHPMYSEAAIKAGKHVFVEKPHGIDPTGVRRMQAACDLAKSTGLSLVSGLQSRYHAGWRETVNRIHDGAIGDVVSMQSMFLRGPYRVYKRPEGMSEIEYQFYNWYHFLWLSGDDVTQSLVHNMDRMSWILGEEMPKWCFGLGGRSASFGEEYGDMFDHHTVIYEYESGPRVNALCRTQGGCYGNSGDVIMGTKGVCQLNRCSIEGETNWRFEGQGNNPYDAEQAALIESVRQGQPINSGDYMVNSTMLAVMGQIACYLGTATTWDETCQSDLQFGPPPEESSFETPPRSLPDGKGNYPVPMPGIARLS